jgi:hypothetical protein
MTGCRQTFFGVFPNTVEKTAQKDGYWKLYSCPALRLMGKHLDDRWGFASLETGLGGEVSGAKIDVGQFSSSGGDRWTIGGLGFEGLNFPDRFFCYALHLTTFAHP